MNQFQFDPTPSPGANRAAAITDCAACNGHRLIEVTDPDGHETYARCPVCNPAPAGRAGTVPEDAWWKT